MANFLKSDPDTMYFYDLCKFNKNRLTIPVIVDSTGSLADVPVRIMNYRTSDGAKVNANVNPYDYSKNQLFRRFFTFDVLSGRKTGKLSAFRIPAIIKFWYI